MGLRVGAITAAADQVEVTLSGRGGHTSRPHLTQDLTYALAKVVTDVPAVLSRRLDPRAGAALVWGSIHSGGAHNVIPSSGKVGGTLRMLDAGIWEGVERLLEAVVHEVVKPYAVQAEVLITKGVPPVVNDAGCIDALTAAVTGTGSFVAPTPQSLGGEDFAWYLTHVPGAMARLGTRSPGGPTYDLHRGDLVVDEGAIVVGARTLAGSSSPRRPAGRHTGPRRRLSSERGRGSVTLPATCPEPFRSCRAGVYSSVLSGPMSSSAPRNLRSTSCVTQPRSRPSSPPPRWASRPAAAAATTRPRAATPPPEHRHAGHRQEDRRRHRLRRRRSW